MPAKGDRVTVYGVHIVSGYGHRPDRVAMEAIPGTVRGETIRLDAAGKLSRYTMTVYVAQACLSREDAVTAFQAQQLARIEQARKDIAEAEANIDASRSLVVKGEES